MSHLQKRHKQTIQQWNLRVGDLILITDHLTAYSQCPLAHVTQVHPDHHCVVHIVIVMTADHNKLRPDLQPETTTLERDTTNFALIKYLEINHTTETIYDRQKPDTEQYI